MTLLNTELNFQLRTLPKPGQQHCGDQCRYWINGSTVTFAVADGLGHGPKAEEAAVEAVTFVGTALDLPIAEIFKRTDRAIRSTRGAALGIGVIDFEKAILSYGCVGNIHAVLIGSHIKIFPATPGIVGCGDYVRFVEDAALEDGVILIVNTDGINNLTSHPPMLDKVWQLPGRLADEIIENWRRHNDDAGLLVYRHDEASS